MVKVYSQDIAIGAVGIQGLRDEGFKDWEFKP